MNEQKSKVLTGKYDILSADEKLFFIRTLDRHYFCKPSFLSFDHEFKDFNHKQQQKYLECKKELSFWSKIRELGLKELKIRYEQSISTNSVLDTYSNYEQCYSENMLKLIYPEYIIDDPSYIKKLLSLKSDELRDKAEKKLTEIGYIMRNVENQSKINSLLNDDNIITPPWITFPDIQRFSIGWRMGGGEDFITYWSLWLESIDREQLENYLSKYKPLPFEWLDILFYYTGYEVDTKKGRVKAYDFLLNIGINHEGDYDSWEKRVDHLFKTGQDNQN